MIRKIAFVLWLFTALSASAEERVVNIYNWAEYIDPALLKQFESETGIKINYDLYDSNEVLEAKLMSGRSGYDVVVPSSSYLERQAKAGIYTHLDKSRLTNYSNLDSEMMVRLASHDPGNAHGVPYAWGTIGIGYNAERVKAALGDVPVDSLAIIFDPQYASKLAECGIAVLDSPSEIMAIALNYLGLDSHSENKNDLRKASELLATVKPYFRYFHSSKYLNDLANGDICLALGYGSDVLIAKNRAAEAGKNVAVNYAIPKEGTVVWFDLMAVPADAPHPDEAYAFIDFLLRGKSAASISNYAHTAVANDAATPFLKQEVAADQGIYPPPEVRARLFTLKAHSQPYDRLLTRAWVSLKTNTLSR